MNRWSDWTRRTLACAVMACVAVGPAAIAWAQDSTQTTQPGQATADASGTPGAHHRHGHVGLIHAALRLDSLTQEQRTAIQQIATTQRIALGPTRLADAAVLSALAAQVEAGVIDRQALAPSIQDRERAGTTARATHRDALQKLHDVLTPVQRGELVDSVEARSQTAAGDRSDFGRHRMELGRRLGLSDTQEQEIRANFRAERQAEGRPAGGQGGHGAWKQAAHAWLEAFRGDSFQAGAMSASAVAQSRGAADRRATFMEDWMQAAVPVLTSAQRSELAAHLRTRAARESRG